MNLQKVYESSENKAVAVMVALFVVSHFGVLYMLSAV